MNTNIHETESVRNPPKVIPRPDGAKLELPEGFDLSVTGWVPDESGQDVWGRPVGVRMIRDGSLLVVDDGGRKVWRVTYKGKK
ncbi:MAG TPA: hypothetical protein VFY40_08965 [Blastocatellia bacterium]|nr:hypothetical protein [Blastocatellia bacterium]